MSAVSKAFFVFMISLHQGGGMAVLCEDQGRRRELKGLADVLNQSEISSKIRPTHSIRSKGGVDQGHTRPCGQYRSGCGLRRRLDVGVEAEQVHGVVTVLDRDE